MTLDQRAIMLTIRHWQASDVSPWDAWDALGGTPLNLKPSWPAVEALALIRATEMSHGLLHRNVA